MAGCIVGSGNHHYEWEENWGKLPKTVSFGYTHGVCEDSQGRIYVHNMSTDAVAVFDAAGTFVESWGAEFADGAHGMHVSRADGDECFFLSDISRKRVYKTTLKGEILLEIPCPMESGVYGDPQEFVPTNTAVAPNGDIYVADGYGKSYIHRFDRDGRYCQTWGGDGEEVGRLRCPHGIAIDTRGSEPRVLVADRKNVRLQYFTLDGRFLSEVTGNLRHPCHFDERGEELLVPDLFGRVTILDGADALIVHLGDNPGVEKMSGYPNLTREHRLPGRFIAPHAGIWDHAGNIFIVEWISDGRVVKLRRQL